MNFSRWRRPLLCRVVPTVMGLVFVWVGAHLGDLLGLVLMIIGLAPAVTGIAGVSLCDELREQRKYQLARRADFQPADARPRTRYAT
jgi:hypothetical protein